MKVSETQMAYAQAAGLWKKHLQCGAQLWDRAVKGFEGKSLETM